MAQYLVLLKVVGLVAMMDQKTAMTMDQKTAMTLEQKTVTTMEMTTVRTTVRMLGLHSAQS